MEITLVTQNLIRGDGQGEVNRRLAEHLARAGHAVHLVASRVDQELTRTPNVVWHRIPLPIRSPALLSNAVFMTLSSLTLQRTGLSDTILHLNGAVSLVGHQVNTCHFCHCAFVEVSRRFRLGLSRYHAFFHRLNAGLERRVFRRCAGPTVAVSRKIQSELGGVLSPGQGTRVIYNGVETATISRRIARESLEKQFGLGRDEIVLLFAGELKRKRKGFGTALEALELLRDNPKVTLVVAGDHRGSPHVAETARRGLTRKVVFCGLRTDLPVLIAGADLFVLPTFYDAFGLVVLEAMAAATPVVVSSPAFCGAAELIADGESGILLQDPSNPKELRDRLVELIHDPELRRRIGEAGKAAARHLTWERMCQQYEEVYREVSSSPPALAETKGLP